MEIFLITLIVLLFGLLTYIFRGIFKSNKTTKFYHKSKFFGENRFEQK